MKRRHDPDLFQEHDSKNKVRRLLYFFIYLIYNFGEYYPYYVHHCPESQRQNPAGAGSD
jgi:hypothetical protein